GRPAPRVLLLPRWLRDLRLRTRAIGVLQLQSGAQAMIGHKSDALAVGTPSWKLHEAWAKGKAHNGVVSQLADPDVIVASVRFHLVKSHTAAVRRDGGIGKDALGSHHAYLLAAAVEPGQLRLGSALSG